MSGTVHGICLSATAWQVCHASHYLVLVLTIIIIVNVYHIWLIFLFSTQCPWSFSCDSITLMSRFTTTTTILLLYTFVMRRMSAMKLNRRRQYQRLLSLSELTRQWRLLQDLVASRRRRPTFCPTATSSPSPTSLCRFI